MNVEEVIGKFKLDISQYEAQMKKMVADAKAMTQGVEATINSLSGKVGKGMQNALNTVNTSVKSNISAMEAAAKQAEAAVKNLTNKMDTLAQKTAAKPNAPTMMSAMANDAKKATQQIDAAVAAQQRLYEQQARNTTAEMRRRANITAANASRGGYMPNLIDSYWGSRDPHWARGQAALSQMLGHQTQVLQRPNLAVPFTGVPAHNPATALVPYRPPAANINHPDYYRQMQRHLLGGNVSQLSKQSDIIRHMMAGTLSMSPHGGFLGGALPGSPAEAAATLKMMKAAGFGGPFYGPSAPHQFPWGGGAPFTPGGYGGGGGGGPRGPFGMSMGGGEPPWRPPQGYWSHNQMPFPTITEAGRRARETAFLNAGISRELAGTAPYNDPRAWRMPTAKTAEDRASLASDARLAMAAAGQIPPTFRQAAGGALNTLANGFNRMGQSLIRLQSSLNPLSGMLDLLHSRFMKIMVLMSAVGLAAYAVRTGLKNAMDYQDTVTSMGVMLGSPEKGKSFVDKLQMAAGASPFEQSTLMQSSRTLAGYGVSDKNLLPMVKAIGEITAASGGGSERFQRISLAAGQVMSKGFLKGEELRQFANAGVGIKNFADAIDVSTSKLLQMMRAGEVGSDVLVKAFNNLTREGGKFGGTMDKLMMNFRGRITFIENQLGLGLQSAGLKFLEGIEKAGGFDILDTWMARFRMNMDNQDVWSAAGDAFRASLIAAETAASSLWQMLQDISSSMKGMSSGSEFTIFEKIAGFFAVLPALVKDAILGVKALVLEMRALMSDSGNLMNMLPSAAKKSLMITNPAMYFALDTAFRNEDASALRAEANSLYGRVGENATKASSDYFENLRRAKAGQYQTQQEKNFIRRQRGAWGSVGLIEEDALPGTTPKFIDKYFEDLYNRGGGAGGFGYGGLVDNSREVGRILGGLSDSYQPNLEASHGKALRDAKQALEDYDKEIPAIPDLQTRGQQFYRNELADRVEALKRASDMGVQGLDQVQYGEGVLGVMGVLRERFGGKSMATTLADAKFGGSAEAQDAINRAAYNQKDGDKQQEMINLLEAMKKDQEEATKAAVKAAEALEAIKDKRPDLFPKKIVGGGAS